MTTSRWASSGCASSSSSEAVGRSGSPPCSSARLVRLGLWELTVSAREGVGHRFETIADSIAVGCVLAGARSWLHRQPLYHRVLVSRWLFLAPVVVVLSGALSQ